MGDLTGGLSVCEAILAMMRYSEIPRDLSADSLRYAENVFLRDDSPPSDNDNDVSFFSGDSKRESKSTIKDKACKPCYKPLPFNTADKPKKHSEPSVGGACLGKGYINYGVTTLPASVKSHSLPPNTSMSCCHNVFSLLRVSPDELAAQITLLDLPCFAAIQPDELTSCAWNKKNKLTVAPNVVAFTRRFNHVSFWTVQEVLSGQSAKHRAEVITHFIKVAKKLFELNNLHSLFAIVSALQSASVFRLSKSWAGLGKKDKLTFDRLAEVFSDKNNWSNLRQYLDSLKLPCIPYLGLFLTDLVYIDMAHPAHSSGVEDSGTPRSLKMNNVLRVISVLQQSTYPQLSAAPATQQHLLSVRYIEELQKFLEDDQYKLSLKLEPPSSIASSTSKESITGTSEHVSDVKDSGKPPSLDIVSLASLSLSPAKLSSGSLRLATGTGATGSGKFIPGHRKCRSLGTKFRSTSLPRNFHKQCDLATVCEGHGHSIVTAGGKLAHYQCPCRIFYKTHHQLQHPQTILPANASDPSFRSRNLIDDSVLEDSAPHCRLGELETRDGDITPTDQRLVRNWSLDLESKAEAAELMLGYQGAVRRKTVLRDGKKPSVTSWQRYWLQLWATSLVYFPPKSFKGTNRSDFKQQPCKLRPLLGWSVLPPQGDIFQLVSPGNGMMYKFKTSTESEALEWYENVKSTAACINIQKPLPANLMSFE